MKELSIEEKAKAYDEAYKVAESIHRFSSNLAEIKRMEDMFPELKESEDERIKKTLIDFFSEGANNDEFTNNIPDIEILAWLEKQGEKKVSYTTLAETGNGGINALVTKELPTNGCNEQKPFDYENATIVQKDFAPKVEPKFHKGEWLCENEPNNYARFIQILETVNVQGKERYRISRDIHNDEDIVEFDFVEKYYHKFDIQDAKDGDVLVDSFSKVSIIILYKGIYKERSILAHCGWNGYNLSIKTNGLGYGELDNTNYLPATKEQRDTLMEAMADAGWEFDFEKKELKKIKQKPTWSEEDSFRTKTLISVIKSGGSIRPELRNEFVNWLKSLKERIGG